MQAIPKAVADAKKLSSKEELILQFADGKCWPVNLLHRKNRCMSSYLYKGWKKFLQDNKIVGGDKLSFEFITDDLIRVHVTRNSQIEHQSGDEASGLLNMDCKSPIISLTIYFRHPIEKETIDDIRTCIILFLFLILSS